MVAFAVRCFLSFPSFFCTKGLLGPRALLIVRRDAPIEKFTVDLKGQHLYPTSLWCQCVICTVYWVVIVYIFINTSYIRVGNQQGPHNMIFSRCLGYNAVFFCTCLFVITYFDLILRYIAVLHPIIKSLASMD